MRMKFREAVGRVQGKDTNAPRNHEAGRIQVRIFVGDLDKAVSGDAALLTHLTENVCFVVVDFPDALQQVRNDRFGFFRGAKLNATSEGEVDQIVSKSPVVVVDALRLTGLTLDRPVVTWLTQVHRPVERVPVETRPVYLEFLVSQLD